VPLPLVFAKVSYSPSNSGRRSKALEAAYYVNPGFFGRFIRGNIFLHVETPWAKIFWRPYLLKIQVFMDQKETQG
jgi:hypothetical protein